MCFSDFIRCYPARSAHPPHPVCARFAEAHRMHLSLAMRPFCTVHNRAALYRRGEKGTERRSLFWTVGYLFACLPKSIQSWTNRSARVRAFIAPHPPFLPSIHPHVLRFSPSFFFFPSSADSFFLRNVEK